TVTHLSHDPILRGKGNLGDDSPFDLQGNPRVALVARHEDKLILQEPSRSRFLEFDVEIVLDHTPDPLGLYQFNLVVGAALACRDDVLDSPIALAGVADPDTLPLSGPLVDIAEVDRTWLKHHVAADVALNVELHLSWKRLVDDDCQRGAVV